MLYIKKEVKFFSKYGTFFTNCKFLGIKKIPRKRTSSVNRLFGVLARFNNACKFAQWSATLMPRKSKSFLNTLRGPYLVTHLLTRSEAALDAPKYLVQCVVCGKSAVYTKQGLRGTLRCSHLPLEPRATATHLEVQAHEALPEFLAAPEALRASEATVWLPWYHPAAIKAKKPLPAPPSPILELHRMPIPPETERTPHLHLVWHQPDSA